MAGDAAQTPRILVVHLTAQQPMTEDGVVFRGRDPITPTLRGQESRGGHVERPEHARGQKVIQALAGDRFHRLRQRDRAEVGIDEGVTGLPEQGRRVDERQRCVARLGFGKQRSPRGHSGRVGEQVFDGHPLFAGTVKRRDVALHRRLEIELALIDQHHRRGRQPNDLREGREVVHRLRGDRPGIVRAVVPDGRQENHAVAESHRDYPTGKRAVHLRSQIRDDGLEAAVLLLRSEGSGV